MGNKNGRTGKFSQDLAVLWRFPVLPILLVVFAAIVSFAASKQLALVVNIVAIGATISLVLCQLFRVYSRGKLRVETEPGLGVEDKGFVAGLSAELGENYRVIHDVQGPDGKIDLIVFGRDGGVFLIDTNSYPGRVEIMNDGLRLNGKSPDEDIIAQTLKNSLWLKDKLAELACGQVGVTPILVFTNAFVQPGTPVHGVAVTNRKYLLNLIYKRNNRDNQGACLWDVKEKLSEILHPPGG
jgi:hypothetical protein